MIDLTSHLLATAPGMDDAFRDGVDAARRGIKPRGDYATLATVRGRHGFMVREAPLLSFNNIKLLGASIPSYGLTMHHFRTVLEATEEHPRLSLNLCPWAGHCVRVCVLNNGHGGRPSVQRAWLWRTDLCARHPYAFARILAWELVQAVRKHGGAILFRPDVNSNVLWQHVLPSLCDGYVAGMTSYGYTKDASVLDGDGTLGAAYRVAYSWNEESDAARVAAFVARGGSVAIVTERRKHAPLLTATPFDRGAAPIVDADKSDEWIFRRGVVGDLSAKGKARQLIGKSAFVVLDGGAAAQVVTMRKRAA